MKNRNWQLVALGLVVVGLIYWLKDVLTPFAVAALIAYLGDPIATRLQRWKLSRSAAVTVVFASMALALILVVLVLVPVLTHQVTHFLDRLPDYLAWIRDVAVPWIALRLGVPPDEIFDTQKIVALLRAHWSEAGGLAAGIIATLSRSGFAFVAHATEMLVIPVVAFYLMRDWPIVIERGHELLPRRIAPTFERLAGESDDVLGAFLRGQLSVMLVLGVFYSVALWLIGIDVAVLIGMAAGLTSFIPYLGAITGVASAVIAAFVQYHDWLHVALVLGVFGVGHMLESWVLQPLLVGDRIGLHPVAVIFAVLFGAHLFGFLGVLLALPVAAVVMVVLRHAHEQYLASALYASNAPAESSVIIVTDSMADANPATAGAAQRVPSPAGDAE